MTTVVVLQPQFLPWLGVFEQIAVADVYVHLDDVQLPLGRSFTTRVQIKTVTGVQWLTVPVRRDSGQTILQARTDDSTDWRSRHVKTLRNAFSKYRFRDDALAIVESVYAAGADSLAEINIAGTEKTAEYLGLEVRFCRSSQMQTAGAKDDLLLSVMKPFGAKTYVTGAGALHYLNHERFDRLGIAVKYSDYAKTPYPQAYGDFTPFVSCLDAIAACGREARNLIKGRTRPWRDVIAEKAA